MCEVNGVSGYLFSRGAGHFGVVGEDAGTLDVRGLVTPVRRFILDGIDRMIGGEEGEFLKGLLIGERGGIPVATRDAFALAGVAHILAVSGSNVAVIAAFLLAVLNLFRMPGVLRSMVVAVGLVVYMVITGSQPPVVRATIMALAVLLGRSLQRRTHPYNTLGLSALVMLCIDARQVFDIGFQLSFGAVLSILYFYPRLMGLSRLRRLPGVTGSTVRAVWSLAAVTLAATLGTLPFTALYFGRVSLVGFATNLFVVPLSGVSVIFGCISCLAAVFSGWVAEAYASLNWIVLRVLLVTTKFSGALPFAAFDIYGFRIAHALPYYGALFCVCSWKSPALFRFHFISLLVAANVVAFVPQQSEDGHAGTLRIAVLDVGQGDAILCSFPGGKHLLIDAGPATPSFDAGRRILVPYLKRCGIDTIHLLVLTHGHADHTGGLAALQKSITIREIIVPTLRTRRRVDSVFVHAPATSLPTFILGTSGQLRHDYPGARIAVLSPESRPDSADGDDGNDASIVLKIQFGQTSFLFCGDAEAPVEDQLVRRFGQFLRSSVLKVPHHGSTSGTTPAFLSAVAPQFAVISVGRNNSFGHPAQVILDRLQNAGCVIHRTDEGGAAMIESDGRQVTFLDWR
jgi:competence protein ComEC